MQLDLIVKGYQDENQKSMKVQRDLEDKLKEKASKLQQQEKQIKEFELKALKERKGIFVEESQEEVSMQAANVMGTSQSISLKQLQEMRDLIKRLQGESDNAKKDLAIQANQFKSQISKLRDEKAEAEKQLYQTEFLVGEKDRDMDRANDESK